MLHNDNRNKNIQCLWFGGGDRNSFQVFSCFMGSQKSHRVMAYIILMNHNTFWISKTHVMYTRWNPSSLKSRGKFNRARARQDLGCGCRELFVRARECLLCWTCLWVKLVPDDVDVQKQIKRQVSNNYIHHTVYDIKCDYYLLNWFKIYMPTVNLSLHMNERWKMCISFFMKIMISKTTRNRMWPFLTKTATR